MLVPPSGERVVEVEQLFGQLVELEPAFGIAIDFEPGGCERLFGAVAEIEAGPLERGMRSFPKARS